MGCHVLFDSHRLCQICQSQWMCVCDGGVCCHFVHTMFLSVGYLSQSDFCFPQVSAVFIAHTELVWFWHFGERQECGTTRIDFDFETVSLKTSTGMHFKELFAMTTRLCDDHEDCTTTMSFATTVSIFGNNCECSFQW